MSAAGYTPAIGAEDPAALEWINAVWAEIPRDVRFRRPGLPARGLKEFIREHAEEIRLQAPFRATVIAAVERATGRHYQPEVRDA